MKLLEKLVAVTKAIDCVPKNGVNQKQGYKFVRSSDLFHAARNELVQQGVLMTFDVVDEERWEKPTMSGGVMNYSRQTVKFDFRDAETGEVVGPFTAKGWGQDTGDKCSYKATTGALKYALRAAFLVPDDTDPEDDSGEAPEKKRNTEREVGTLKASTEKNRGHGNEGLAEPSAAASTSAGPSFAFGHNLKACDVEVTKTEATKQKNWRVLCKSGDEFILANKDLFPLVPKLTGKCSFLYEEQTKAGKKYQVIMEVTKIGDKKFAKGREVLDGLEA